MAKTPPSPSDPNSVTVTQQALNLARQIISAVGWAKSVDDIYIGGKLLAETFPENDSLDWIKPDEEVRLMTKAQRQAYVEKDRKWASTLKTFAVSEKEKAAFKKAFEHFASEGKLGPNEYISELIVAFKLVKDE